MMARLQLSTVSFALLQAIAVLAAPNGSPTGAQPALRVLSPGTLPTATALAAASNGLESVELQFQEELKKRQVHTSDVTGSATPTASSSLTLANSFTSNMSLPGAASTVSGPAGMATGMFTGADGGIYDVTSVSGYVVIDYKTLYPGQGALIGNEPVTNSAGGILANGVAVGLSTVTPAATTPTTSSTNTVISGSSIVVSTSSRSMMAASTITETVSSSTSAAAAAAMQTAGQFVVAAGGLLGLMVL